ncbi:pyridoxine 5'-phosphate synthase [Myxococcus xanthus]|uniref:Pyridoxine 5'-phosphate synthase n=1 Tax=Myxococcus xanthus TaxID=34 RepID=A0A4Y6CD01_MYXXA|nr:pyridoxine 5'-phosphate synthase [Myxococcus xanthus]NOJ78355.1 pyridoxine 5'-phosphate synthase [Myxococcus xanthus]NOJ85449.1 pyridoxine 5'-phosphate synthase [Myxococcus xanthus]QDE91163.1 pyridoxine 5'-phosphate synthase [Myxococcus xanthus]
MGQRLGVNVDHVATLRQARRTTYPDPVTAAALAELAGAQQITIHLREDRRHIQDRDLRILRETVQTLLNLEMAATAEMVKLAYEHKPDVVTLVPERREELTTEGGLEVANQREHIAKIIKNLKDGEIAVSLFIDPDLDQVRAAHKVNADRIELHTGRYCEARNEKERARELARIVDAAKAGIKLGLGVAAGHGLNYDNVHPIARISEIDELNIGHAIVGRAVLVGFERAVREMLEIMRNPG